MATPISNNPILPGGNKTSGAEEKYPGQGHRQEKATSSAVNTQDDAVSVSRAAQVLNEQPIERGQGVIRSAEQAAQVARGLKALFENNNGQALAGQTQNVSPDLVALLKVS